MPRLFLLVLHITVALHRVTPKKVGNSGCGTERTLTLNCQATLWVRKLGRIKAVKEMKQKWKEYVDSIAMAFNYLCKA